MSKLKEKAYIDKIREQEIQLAKKDEHIQALKIQAERKRNEHAEDIKTIQQLRQQIHTIMGSQINRSEHEQLKIENTRLKMQYHNVTKRLREVLKFVEGLSKGGVEK